MAKYTYLPTYSLLTSPSCTRTQIKAMKCGSLTNMLINWYFEDTIGIHYFSIDNTIFNEPSGPNF